MKMIIALLVGGAIGFAVGCFGRCGSGVCPLTSNPLVSTIVGALIGFTLALAKK